MRVRGPSEITRSIAPRRASGNGCVDTDLVRPHVRLAAIVAEDRRVADQAQRERGARIAIDLARRSLLLDPSVVHHDQAIGDLHRLVRVVGDQQRRHAVALVQLAQARPQLGPDADVEGGERLVEQQHLRMGGERSRQRHALTLAAGELARQPALEALELDQLEQLGDARGDLAARAVPHGQREADVLGHAQVLEERALLVDEADATLAQREIRDVPPADRDRADVRPLEARDAPEQRRLAAARGAERLERARRTPRATRSRGGCAAALLRTTPSTTTLMPAGRSSRAEEMLVTGSGRRLASGTDSGWVRFIRRSSPEIRERKVKKNRARGLIGSRALVDPGK